MKIRIFLQSILVEICYCLMVVLLPNFNLYVEFRGIILPSLYSVILTVVNFKSIMGKVDYFIKLVLYVFLGYILRLLIFFVANGYFDVNFLYLKNDWYLLYMIMQIPTIVVSSLFTLVILRIISKMKS